MSTLQPPRKLEKKDERRGFESGADELDSWFERFAWENQAANNAVTYVAMLDETVVGYYSICSAGVGRDHVPADFGKRRPQDIPCILLARLAVDQRYQGHRIGVHLLRDAIGRAVSASEAFGAACLLIHARDEKAKEFYLRHGDFLQSPVEEMHLILPMKVARRLVSS